jgi:hypothetical protein
MSLDMYGFLKLVCDRQDAEESGSNGHGTSLYSLSLGERKTCHPQSPILFVEEEIVAQYEGLEME